MGLLPDIQLSGSCISILRRRNQRGIGPVIQLTSDNLPVISLSVLMRVICAHGWLVWGSTPQRRRYAGGSWAGRDGGRGCRRHDTCCSSCGCCYRFCRQHICQPSTELSAIASSEINQGRINHELLTCQSRFITATTCQAGPASCIRPMGKKMQPEHV